MSNIVKHTDQIKFEDDLDKPTLGTLIKDDTLLMGSWATIAIGSFLYLQPFGIISFFALAFLGYRDVKATSRKQAENEVDQSFELMALTNGDEVTPQVGEAGSVKSLPSGPTYEGTAEEPAPVAKAQPEEKAPTNTERAGKKTLIEAGKAVAKAMPKTEEIAGDQPEAVEVAQGEEDDLKRIKGIGPAKYRELKPLVRVE